MYRRSHHRIHNATDETCSTARTLPARCTVRVCAGTHVENRSIRGAKVLHGLAHSYFDMYNYRYGYENDRNLAAQDPAKVIVNVDRYMVSPR